MKQIVLYTLVLLLSQKCLAISDAEFSTIKMDHAQHYGQLCKERGESKTPYYMRLEMALQRVGKIRIDHPLFVVTTGQDLAATHPRQGHNLLSLVFTKIRHRKIERFFKNNPEATLIVDVQQGDGFVLNNNSFQFSRDYLPRTLRSLWLSNLTQDVIKFESSFLAQCDFLTSVRFSPFSSAITIDKGFGQGCRGLKALDLRPFSNVIYIHEGFLMGCVGLRHINLDALPLLEEMGDDAFKECESLTTLDFSQNSNLNTLGRNPFTKANSLQHLYFTKATQSGLIKNVIAELNISPNHILKNMGMRLFKNYLFEPSPGLQNLLTRLNLETLFEITPQMLDDMRELDGQDIVKRYMELFERVKTKLDPPCGDLFWKKLKPILMSLFVSPNQHVTWRMYEENREELRVAFKHALLKLEDMLMKNQKGLQEAASYLSVLILGFGECQSRQAGEINQVLTAMGLHEKMADGLENRVYQLVNEFKMEAFNEYATSLLEDNEGMSDEHNAHRYTRRFTVINLFLGLPVAMRGFQEQINPVTPQDMENMLWIFFTQFFTPEKMTSYIHKALLEDYNASEIRGIIAARKGGDFMSQFDDYNIFFQPLSRMQDNPKFDWEESPVTEREIRYLLQNMKILKSVFLKIKKAVKKNYCHSRVRKSPTHIPLERVS